MSNEQVAPEEPTCGMCHQRIYLAGDEWKHRIDDSIWCPRMTARPAALAKQGSPPKCPECGHNDMGRDGLCKESVPLIDKEPHGSRCCNCPCVNYGLRGAWWQADTDERARGAQVEGIIEDWIAANPSLVGELEIQIVRDLSDRISAALVEKDAEIERLKQVPLAGQEYLDKTVKQIQAEVWDKAAEIAERHNEGHNYDYRNCGLAIATAIREAARTSEREK